MNFEITSGVKTEALKVVAYGPEGVGKSSFAAQFPNPLFIDTEESTTHMNVNRLPNPTSFTMLMEELDFVIQNKPCATLIVDTADWAQTLAENQVLAENSWKSIESPGYGAGYVAVREKWTKFLDKLSDVREQGINVVLTAHSEIKKFEDPTDLGAYDRYELKLSKRSNGHIAGVTKEWADMVLFLNYDVTVVKREGMGNKYAAQGGQRKIYTEHSPQYDAKNRFGLAPSLPLDYSSIAHVVPNLNQDNTQQQQVQTEPVTQSTQQTVAPTQTETAPDPFASQAIQQTPEQVAAVNEQVDTAFGIQHHQALPKELTDLMNANDVSDDEIRGVMGVRGHFPINTPFENIANSTPEYFTGGLASNWEGVMEVVHQIRANPQMLIDLFVKVNDANPSETVSNMDIKVGV